jgi:hypothetical protein
VTVGGKNFTRSTLQCNGTYVLREGTLAASAAVINGNPKIAVVGGTGAYEGARGSITERELPKERTENTVHLLP